MSDRLTANDELASLIANRTALERPDNGYDSELSWPCLLLRIGSRWCGLRAEVVSEVVAPETITVIPGQPAHVLGVALVHGSLIPVIDISALMKDLEISLATPGRRMAVVSQGDAELGLVADDAKGVIELPVPEYDPASAKRQPFILGEVRWEDELVCLLDAQALIHAAIGLE